MIIQDHVGKPIIGPVENGNMIKLLDLLKEDREDYYIDRKGKKFKVIDLNYLEDRGTATVQYTDSNEPVEYKGNLQADLKSGIIKYLNSDIN